MPLTDVAVRSAKPSEKTRKLFDSQGLYLEVTPAGSKRWRWRYRWCGREKLLSMGVYPAVSLLEARRRRDDARTERIRTAANQSYDADRSAADDQLQSTLLFFRAGDHGAFTGRRGG